MLNKPGKLKIGGRGFQASLKFRRSESNDSGPFFREIRNPKKEMDTAGKEKGSTLIELLVGIVVLAFAILSLIQLFSNLSVSRVHASYRNTGTLLTQELMEEIMSKRFDEMEGKDASGYWSTTGVDTGETAGNKSTFDDVDDFSGWSEALTGDFNGFTRTASVIYVAPGNLNTASTRDNEYKRITVQVYNGGNKYSELISIATPVNSEGS
jgi:Tfp pilus assembly protein PilV